MTLADLLTRELQDLSERGLRRTLRPLESPQSAVVRIAGRTAINLSSNNYLGLATAPALAAAARAALSEGTGAGASRLLTGSLPLHAALERDLADFHHAEAALLFGSGYQANVGVVTALAGPGDALFSDALNHASLIDGCRLSGAAIHVFPHRDTAALAVLLDTTPARRRFVLTDTLFSMDGDLAPLRELRHLADRHGAYLLADEAHATGVLGPGGRGLAAALEVPLDVHVATLGKALGGYGAYVTGPRPLIDYLVNRARSFVFTTALPPAVLAAASAALSVSASHDGDTLRATLRQRIAYFGQGLAHLGLLRPGAGETPLFPVLIGNDRRALAVTEALLEHGILAQAVRPPTVPPGTARLRLSLMATHDVAELDQALEALGHLVQTGLLEASRP